MLQVFSIKTQKKHQLFDITDKVLTLLKKEKFNNGSLLIFARHTTCAIIISEIEENLEADIIRYLEKEGPKGPFNHSHGDESHTPSHILSAIIGQSRIVPIKNNQPLLGTWQRICLLEMDGPRTREILLQVL